jgi:hypothetical protein
VETSPFAPEAAARLVEGTAAALREFYQETEHETERTGHAAR